MGIFGGGVEWVGEWLIETMVMRGGVSGVSIYSNAQLLLVHWPSQKPHIHSPEPVETLGPPEGMHMQYSEGVRTVLRSSI